MEWQEKQEYQESKMLSKSRNVCVTEKVWSS